MLLLTICRPKVNTTVLRTTTLNVYTYKSTSLFLAYGLAILTSLLANILGIIAYLSNGSAHDRNFSAILGATRERELSELFDEENHGTLPVPKPTKRTLLKFRDMDEGGWSFRREERKLDLKDWKALMDRRTSVVKKPWNWRKVLGFWRMKAIREKRG